MVSSRPRRLSRQDKRVLGGFAAEHSCCWACGIGDGELRADGIEYPRRLVIHHIVKPGRVHQRWNLARLCSLCHDLAEGYRIVVVRGQRRQILPRLELGNVLWLKRRHDAEHYDRMALQRHTRAGRRLPRGKIPAGWFFQQTGIAWSL